MQKIVGHKTMQDGSRQPLYETEAHEIWKRVHDAKEKRAKDMPTEQDAINVLAEAFYRLKELGWREACYCPKDGSIFSVIEAGSTGIHACNYDGEWPKGSYWIHADGDLWPSRPILFKKPDNEKQDG